jgi:hypothetical protein
MSGGELCQLVSAQRKTQARSGQHQYFASPLVTPQFEYLPSTELINLILILLIIDTTKLDGTDIKCPGVRRWNVQ